MSNLETQLKAKYGEEEGKKRFLEKNIKLSNTLKEKNRLKKLEDPLIFAKRSKKSIHYYTSRGFTLDEAKEQVQILYKEHSKKIINNWKNGVYKDSLPNTKLQYWINLGYSETDAKEKLKERQRTFSLEKCIKKFGEIEGLERWKKRQSDWQKTLNNKTDEEKQIMNKKKALSLENFILRYGELGKEKYLQLRENKRYIRSDEYFQLKFGDSWKIEKFKKIPKIPLGFSKISQKLFWKIIEDKQNLEHIYFGELNKEFIIKDSKNFKCYLYDFVDTKNKKCIEFNGDLFHANPEKYNENDTPNPYNKNITAKEIWEYDKNKNNFLIEKGYDILVIWENDYRKTPDIIIEKCKKFIEG